MYAYTHARMHHTNAETRSHARTRIDPSTRLHADTLTHARAQTHAHTHAYLACIQVVTEQCIIAYVQNKPMELTVMTCYVLIVILRISG